MPIEGIRPEIKAGSPSLVVVVARVKGAANSNPSTIKGATVPISSVTRQNVGRYRVFLRNTWPQVEAITASVQDTNYDTTPTRKIAKVITHAETNATAASRYIDILVAEPGFVVDEFTNALASSTNALRTAAASAASTQTVLAAALTDVGGKAELLARPRSISFTVAGATAAHAPTAGVITGTDINGDALTESVTITASAGTYEGAKAFKTITSISLTGGTGTGATVAIGFGNKFGLSRKAKTRAGAVMRGTEISAGSVVTNGTLVVAETGLPNGTYTPNTAPNGTNDYAISYETDGASDLSSTEWLHVTLHMRNTSLGVS